MKASIYVFTENFVYSVRNKGPKLRIVFESPAPITFFHFYRKKKNLFSRHLELIQSNIEFKL